MCIRDRGEVGASDFSFTYKQKMCIGSGSGDAIQLGGFQANCVSGSGVDRKIVAGVRVLKNKAGKTASLIFYVNDKPVESIDIDLSYTNKYFGTGSSAIQTSSITKRGKDIKFSVGDIARVFSDDTVADVKAVSYTHLPAVSMMVHKVPPMATAICATAPAITATIPEIAVHIVTIAEEIAPATCVIVSPSCFIITVSACTNGCLLYTSRCV